METAASATVASVTSPSTSASKARRPPWPCRRAPADPPTPAERIPMSRPRPFRFAAQISGAGSAKEWAERARQAEDLGYSTLTMPDHFGDQLAPVPALMAAAQATTSLRIGTLLFDNDYKPPLALANEAATLDL